MESGYLACQLSWTPVMTTALYGASYLQTQTELLKCRPEEVVYTKKMARQQQKTGKTVDKSINTATTYKQI
jgi:hypothetical protein